MESMTSRRAMCIGLRLASVVAVGTGSSVIARGAAAIPGAEPVDASVDNVLRFYAAWTGAGVLMWWIAPDTRAHDGLLRGVLAINAAGGLVRLWTTWRTGRPHVRFQAIAIEELIFSPVLLVLQRRITGAPSTAVVGPVGLEPTTRGLKVRCSDQLS